MPKNRDDIKILLLQIREDEETMLEEYYEFVQFSGLRKEQIIKLNTYQTADFDPDVMDGFDALFVGGSSDASVLAPEEFRFVGNCKRLLRYCYQQSTPVFASCFGFQILVEELGGQVILDKDNMEMGIYAIHTTDAAKKDPLTHDLPSTFYAVSGHKERAVTIPKDCEVLAYSELCPFHIIKFHDKPIYGFQFHPEVDRKDLITRITRYQERYLNDAAALQAIIDNAVNDTPESTALVRKFVDRCI